MKILTLCLFFSFASIQAQTLTKNLIGSWQFKKVLDASGNPLKGTFNRIELNLNKDSTFSMYTKTKKLTGEWIEKDSTLYLQVLPEPDSVNHTQVMRILKLEANMMEIYVGTEKGNEIHFIYTRRRKK